MQGWGSVAQNYLDSIRQCTYPLRMPLVAFRAAVVCAALAAVASQALATTANDVCAPTADPCLVNGTVIVTPGSVLDFGNRALVFPGGSGKKLELGPGAGVRTMMILARSVTIEPGSAIIAKSGFVDIRTAGNVVVRRSGSTRARIDVSDQVFPGSITIQTAGPNGDVIIEGTVTAQGTGIDAGGGTVDISVSSLTSGGDLVLQGEILAGGGGNSLGGDVVVFTSGNVTSTGTINTSAGDGGDVDIVAGGNASILAAGTAKIDVQGLSAGGDSGDLDIQSLNGDVVLAQPVVATGAPEIDFAGSGGTVSLYADQGSVTIAGAVSAWGAVPDGDGGEVSATAALDITQTGAIAAQGRRLFGTGGFIDYAALRAVRVGPIDVSGECAECGGGDVDVSAFCDVTLPSAISVLANGVNGTVRISTGDTMRVAGIIRAGGRVDLAHRNAGTPPNLSGSTIVPSPLVMVDGTLPQCGCMPGPCGDGVLNCGEACDDGNTQNDATCTADCSREPSCGDGFRDLFLGEACDDGNQVDCDGCARTCQTEACGNFVTECSEQCDEGGVTTPTCQADCRLPPPAGCGDGVHDPAFEQCDDGNLEDCDGCNRLCALETCGNGITECAEECDDFNNDPCDDCSPTCRFEVCGNGIVDCGEECDDGAQNGQPGSVCLADVCLPGEICQVGGPSACIPCQSDAECNVCAGLTCNPQGVCESSGVDCNDGNPCTLDGCSALTGCTHELRNGPDVPECDDGKACTIAECDATLGCVQRVLTDFEGITCHFTTLDELLLDPDVDEKARRVLGKLRTKAAAGVSKAAEGEQLNKLTRVKRGLKKARGRLRKMRIRVERFAGKRITSIDTAAALAAEIDDAVLSVEDLLAAFGFPV